MTIERKKNQTLKIQDGELTAILREILYKGAKSNSKISNSENSR